MNIPLDELITILAKFNPWWRNDPIPFPSTWRRAVFNELFNWIYAPPVSRAVLLSGARQVGKTTLLQQVIADLLNKQVPAANILYVTFDHPLIKLAGIDAVMEAWRLREAQAPGPEYLFLDEAQFISDGETWIKHQVDFNKNRRITFTGSAMPLIHKWQESGPGRWHTIRLSTLSFYEYIQLKQDYGFIEHKFFEKFKEDKIKWDTNIFQNFEPTITIKNIENFNTSRKYKHSFITDYKISYPYFSHMPPLPKIKSFQELFTWTEQQFSSITEQATPFVVHFHEYLMKGGFPQSVKINDINQAQRLLREDIIDKVLKRDMTALFNVRHILDLERIFLYLCMHDGGLLDLQTLCQNLEVKRPTAEKYIELLEATHLIYKLQPFGYGKDILRAKHKIYLADAAISSAVLLRGKTLLDDPEALGIATETAVFKHIYSTLYARSIGFNYWQGKNKKEVDIIAQVNQHTIPFEIKYREQHTNVRDMKGLHEFCKEKSPPTGYLITKSLSDFNHFVLPETNTRILRIPAPLFCYWMGEVEHELDSEFNLFV